MASDVQRAAQEPDRLEFESRVVACDGRAVELSETFFFARSGGQPADRGSIDGIEVVGVRADDGRILHDLAAEPTFTSGEAVAGQVDPSFRTYCRRAHTASHVVYGAGRLLFDELGYGGFEIDEEKVRIDIAASARIDESTLIDLERLANEAVWSGYDVSWGEIPVGEARAHDEIAFNVATEERAFADGDRVRVVEIEDWDVAACGGTHVRNTAEIGPIRMLDRSNPGSGLTRVEFAVGPTAIAHQSDVHEDVRMAARALDTTLGSITEAIEARSARIEDQRSRIEDLESALLEHRLASLSASPDVTSDRGWVVGEFPSVSGDQLGATLRRAVAEGDAGVLVAVTGDDRSSVAVASDETIAADEVVDQISSSFGGGGGGGPAFAQGGGIPATPAEVVANIREEVIPRMSEAVPDRE